MPPDLLKVEIARPRHLRRQPAGLAGRLDKQM